MAAHRKDHALNSSYDHTPGTNSTLLGTESSAIVEKTFGTSVTASYIVQRDSNADVLVPNSPTSNTAATSKLYVDTKVAEGITWKELVLVSNQLRSVAAPNGAILQAILAAITNNSNLATNDTFEITDGTTTETWTFKGTRTTNYEVAIGGSESATTDNLVAAIATDSSVYNAVKTTGLDIYLSGGNDPQFVVYRRAYSTASDRVFGTIAAGQSNIQVVAFTDGSGTVKVDYTKASGTQSDLPSSAPASRRFGFARAYAALVQGETHRVSNDNTAYTWDGDDNTWQMTSTPGAVSAGDGIDVSALKVSAKTATSSAAQQYGALVKDRNSDGSGPAGGADLGYLAVKTDNTDLAVDASNQLVVKPASRLDKFIGFGSWTSETAPDKEPTGTELDNYFGSGATKVGYWAFMVESGTAVGSSSTFIAYKKASGVYHLVELAA